MESTSKNILRRYTDVTSLFHILVHQKITLLNPSTWDDKNDSEFINIYKEKANFNSLLALCFTESPETYHHWKVFAPGSSGICIRFKKREFLEHVEKSRYVIHRKVIYKKLKDLKKDKPSINNLPFLKRYAFRDEKEYRIIYKSNSDNQYFKSIDVNLNCISRIVLSPWLPKNVAETLKVAIKAIEGCEEIRIIKTTLNENATWLSYGRKACITRHSSRRKNLHGRVLSLEGQQ